MNLKKTILLFCSIFLVLLTGCPMDPDLVEPHAYKRNETLEDINPNYSEKTSESQDFIFSTDSIGFTTITIRRSEWNKMLSYFDYFYKNENSVIAESYEYEKDGQKWKLNTVGFRLRGNTSRFRPQGKDSPEDETGHRQPNADWSEAYYNYAADCDDNVYRQSHFKIDFEPYDEDDRKMSGCMKGVALKRCDSVFSREIFCYNMFHQYGIWTAPRASQTKVYINFIEDVKKNGTVIEDKSDCKTTKIDFGVYEMFEEVNKQSLKGRMSKKKNNSAKNAWKNNDGDLWKCSGGDLTSNSNSAGNFGCEEVLIFNTDRPKAEWTWKWFGPCYDLKTNKSNVNAATSYFQNFIKELNDLSDISQFTTEGIEARKAFYEKWFDVDFFIKTYAVNILLGMDDDYWGNANNYYLYFDNGKDGTGKCYYIPFDYDNSLGCSITGDRTYTNPFNWGNGKNRPLLDRLLEVPEYVSKFKSTLLEISSQASDSPWNRDNCISIWDKWYNQVNSYVYSENLKGWPDISSIYYNRDEQGWKEKPHCLIQNSNDYYSQVTGNFNYWLSVNANEINFDLNGGSMNGSTGTVTASYNGVNLKFSAITGIPERPGYEFLGWTKTRDGTDYTDTYGNETDLTVYASWKNLSGLNGLSIFEIKDSTYDGIKIGIVNLPATHYRRTFYINGKEAGGDSFDNPDKYKKIWAYPFTEKGKSYEVSVTYSDVNYAQLEQSNTITIKAQSGKGEFKLRNQPEFSIQKNLLKWKTEPRIQIGNSVSPRTDSNWEEYYLIEIQSTMKKDSNASGGCRESWNYQSWNYLGASCGNNFNFKDHVNEEVLNGTRYDLRFRMRYNYNSSPYGDLCLIIFDYGDVSPFNIK